MDSHIESSAPEPSSYGVQRVGIDTVSFAWRPKDDALWSRLAISTETGAISGIRRLIPSRIPNAWMLKEPLSAARWIICPDAEMIFCEGRLAAMLSGNYEDRSLAPFSELLRAADSLSLDFGDLVDRPDGLDSKPASVRRLDLAVDLRFTQPLDGLATMRLLADVTIPRVKTCEWRDEGRTETIAYYTATKHKRLLHRIYDKGVEAKTDPPGSLLRFERQHRWEKTKQRSVDQLVRSENPGKLWLAGFESWAETASRAATGGPDAAQRALIRAIEDGTVGREQGERLLGSLAIAQSCGEGWWKTQGKAHLGRRRRAELAKLGLSLAPRGYQVRELSLAGPIRALREAWNAPGAPDEAEQANRSAPAPAGAAARREEGAEEPGDDR